MEDVTCSANMHHIMEALDCHFVFFSLLLCTCSQGIRIWSPPPTLSFKTKINLLNNFEGFFQLLTDVSQGLRRFSAKAVLNNSFQKLFQEEINLKKCVKFFRSISMTIAQKISTFKSFFSNEAGCQLQRVGLDP